MNSEYPPLPRSGARRAHNQTNGLAPQPGIPERLIPSNRHHPTLGSKPSSTTKVIISKDGDVIIEYTDQHGLSKVTHRWQVASEMLMRNSPYFRALLDPCKFAEGRRFMEEKQGGNGSIALAPPEVISDQRINPNALRVLPTVKIPTGPFTRMFGVDAIELFLHILCLDSLADAQRSAFETELKSKPPSLIARLIEAADAFNSPDVIRDALRKISYSFGKGKPSPFKLGSSLLKVGEDRIRQSIFVAMFMHHHATCQVFTHALLLLGSRYWANGPPEAPATDTLRWRYLPDGIEEQLYYRRQCVLNTITDLQAYFLRAYGGLEDIEESNPKPPIPSTAPSLGLCFTTTQPRHFQCRGGFGNSSACDLFHLGQMTRFFSLKSKTVFLGSALLDPDFSLTENEAEDHFDTIDSNKNHQPSTSAPQSDITAIIASLKQYPDYQIDTHHLGCGVRRRFLPALDCIEKFIWDIRGLLGIDPRVWDRKSARASWSRAYHPGCPRHTVDVRFARITAVRFLPNDVIAPRSTSIEDEARLLFTASKRNWEA